MKVNSRRTQKANIKGGTVRDNGRYIATDECQQLRTHGVDWRCICYIAVTDTGNLSDARWDGFRGLYQCIKTLQFAITLKAYCSNFDNVIVVCVQTCSFQVNGNKYAFSRGDAPSGRWRRL